ncbi:MAG: putative nicotinate-nucleotide adenylyltransferase [Pseudomonadota bacterium]|jgi:nicotinate-nucleotide adenylyltransferase
MIGILGGTFNPIHLGHLHLANQLQTKLGFDSIRFMPAALPALKDKPNVTAEQRAEMVKIAIANQPHFSLDTRELSRAGTSYTIDTLISLREELGDEVSICWLMGFDAFANLDAWHRWQELLNKAHLIVVKRPHSSDLSNLNAEVKTLLEKHETKNVEEVKKQAYGKILIQEIAALDISSTEIREKIAQDKDVRSMVPEALLSYIQQHQLYR